MSNFHLVRRLNASRDQSRRVPVEPEILASRISFDLKDDLMLRGAANRTARLVVGYFPVIDDFNHAYLDLFLRKDARATALFHVCVTMVDGLLKRLMQRMQDDELLVISSDHGGMPFSSMLHVNEILADAGLVRRGARGYDFRRSLAWYHPSDCGQVVAWDLSRREALLKRLRAALDIANTNMGADIGLLEGDGDSPYLAFLYPRGIHISRAARAVGAALSGTGNGRVGTIFHRFPRHPGCRLFSGSGALGAAVSQTHCRSFRRKIST